MHAIKERKTANHRLRRQRTGAAAVEFAFAISILLMIVFASIEFVRLSMLKHSVEHASYLAARRGIIIGATSSDVEGVAQVHLTDMQLTGTSVVVSPSNINDETQIVEVVISVPVSGNSWISPLYFGGSINGRTRMMAERAAAEMSTTLAGG